MTILVEYIKKHIESIHEGVCYPCYQCDYKANMLHLKQYLKLVHERVVHPWDLCDNKATRKLKCPSCEKAVWH